MMACSILYSLIQYTVDIHSAMVQQCSDPRPGTYAIVMTSPQSLDEPKPSILRDNSKISDHAGYCNSFTYMHRVKGTLMYGCLNSLSAFTVSLF